MKAFGLGCAALAMVSTAHVHVVQADAGRPSSDGGPILVGEPRQCDASGCTTAFTIIVYSAPDSSKVAHGLVGAYARLVS